jgi:hypothetical protein
MALEYLHGGFIWWLMGDDPGQRCGGLVMESPFSMK